MTIFTIRNLIRTAIATCLMFAATVAVAQTTISGNFLFDGINRTYRIYIPEIYDPATPVPLIFNLHGYASNNEEQEQYADFRPIADTANFIIAHPNGTPDFMNNNSWNTFGGLNVDDVGFLSALADTISTLYNIDPNRIYSTGMSNGGFMSYDLACFLSERIAAVASVTGSMIWPRFNTCNALHPTPVMQIHGTADATVPYNGNLLFAHVDSLVSYWVQFNNCLPEPEIIQVPDIDPNDGCTAIHHIYSEGNSGIKVEFFKIIGGGHSWPGAPININITNMDFSACAEIWRFFRQYRLDQLVSGTGNKPQIAIDFKIFPNPATSKAFLSLPSDINTKDFAVQITNIFGQPVHSSILSKGKKALEIDISHWPTGLYLVQIITDKGIVTNLKLVVGQ